MRKGWWSRGIVLVFLMVAGCGENPDVILNTAGAVGSGSGGGGGGATVALVTVTGVPAGPYIAPTSLAVSQQVQFTAVATDALGAVVSGITFSWVSSAPSVATISSTGLMEALVPGTTNITATGGGVTSVPIAVEVDCNSVPTAITNILATLSTISTFATSSITLDVEDCLNGTLPEVPDGTVVNFSVSPSSVGTVTSTATTVTGTASATFSAANVQGIATITATVAGTSVSNSVTVTITAPPVGSIEFGAASPDVIGVKGSGQTETSTITFLVKDVNGNDVVDGTSVIYTVIGPQGTSSSDPAFPTPTTDQEQLTFYTVSTVNGVATTTLLSGTVAGTVRIIACVDNGALPGGIAGNGICDGAEISSSSTPVSIGGGIPSATHFSVARTIVNLPGLAYVNEQTVISAFLADRFGNFNVLTGTSISFWTEAGAIDRSAVTDAEGTVSVVLRSQNPMPIDVSVRDPLNPLGQISLFGFGETYNNLDCSGFDGATTTVPVINEPFEDANDNGVHDDGSVFGSPCEHFTDFDTTTDTSLLPLPGLSDGYDLNEPNPRDGWVEVLVFTRGEEAFSDLNGNGVYDAGEPFTDNGGEPFIDSNDNGIYDPVEVFTDTNSDNSYQLIETFTDADPGEPFLDVNSTGTRDAGEPFTDVNANGTYEGPGAAGFQNGVWDPGEQYVDINGDGQWTHGNGVWDADTTIWLTTTIVYTHEPDFGPFTTRIVIDNNVKDPVDPSTFFIPNGGSAGFTLYVSDFNANALTPESTVSISATGGTLLGGGTFVIADGLSTGPLVFRFSVADDDSLDLVLALAFVEVTITWESAFAGTIVYDMVPIFGTLNGP